MMLKKTHDKPVVSSSVIVGDAKEANNSTKKPTKKIILAVILLCALTTGLLTALIIYNNDQQETDIVDSPENFVNNPETVKQVTESYQQIASGPAPTNSVEEFRIYHTSILWLKVKDNDTKGIAEYYVNEVAPKQIPLDLALKENILDSLLKHGYNQEAKTLIADILNTYKTVPVSPDPNTQQAIDAQINKYTQLEKTL